LRRWRIWASEYNSSSPPVHPLRPRLGVITGKSITRIIFEAKGNVELSVASECVDIVNLASGVGILVPITPGENSQVVVGHDFGFDDVIGFAVDSRSEAARGEEEEKEEREGELRETLDCWVDAETVGGQYVLYIQIEFKFAVGS
jgi:hypothetical protein